jgi:adenylate cyclase
MERFRKGLLGAIAGISAAAAAIVLWNTGWLTALEAKSWDWRAAVLAAPGRATDDIRLILLDDKSLAWGRDVNGLSWPWPREVVAGIVEYCRISGVKALALDVIFSEPSVYGVADDQALAGALSDLNRTVGALHLTDAAGRTRKWPEAIPSHDFDVAGIERVMENPRKRELFTRKSATFPVEGPGAAFALFGNVQQDPDPDDVFRNIRPFTLFDEKFVPTLGLAAYLAARPETELRYEGEALQVDDKTIPLTPAGKAHLRYRGPSGTHKSFSAAAVLQSHIRRLSGETPTIPPEALKDKYVFYGYIAPALKDLRPAPPGAEFGGVEIHATFLDNLLSNDFIKNAPLWTSTLLIIASALACALFPALIGSTLWGITGGGIFLLLPIPLSFWAYQQGFRLPMVPPLCAAGFALVFALVINYVTEGRQKRFIRSTFSLYLSPAVIDQLIQNPDKLKLGGERRELSIFFSDLEGFTSISEALDPERLSSLLNDYLSEMTDIILQTGGTIDKYEGDAIIAFWNAPVDVPDHAVRVVGAALACQARLEALRPVFRERINGRELKMRIGINTGIAVVGNFGSKKRFDYTMLGDAVNLAARLESTNKQFGLYTLISEATRKEVGEAFAVREVGRVAVVGRGEPVTVFEPMEEEVFEAAKRRLVVFHEGLQRFYRGDFEKAAGAFQMIAGDDPAARAYLDRIEALGGVPPSGWRGVWVMTTK